MKYGYFDDQNREYVITNPRTPVKWINYVGTLGFGGFVDHTGGLLLCKGDPALNRITKYIPQLPGSQLKGQTLYLRRRSASGSHVFSPLFVPTLDEYQRFECRVGLGYTRFVTEFHGVRTELTVFVPTNAQILLQEVVITNLSDENVEVDAIPLLEYTHFDALKQFTNADWVPQTMQSEVHDDAQGRKILAQFAFMNRDQRQTYFTASERVSSYETDRRMFLGDNEYGTFQQPKSLEARELSNTLALRGDNIGALMLPLGAFAPGESKRFVTQLTQQEGGKHESLAAARALFERFRSPEVIARELETMRASWDEYLSTVQVDTPDASMNSMLNVHNPRQCYMTKNWSRDLSLYQLGFGGRGIGFRDSSQDVLGVMAAMPEEARELMEKLLSVMKSNGSAMHQFYASTMVATEGDAREMEDRPKFYGDDHLWIVFSVCAYLKETGNLAFLDQRLPYYRHEKDKQDAPRESGTVFDHLQRAVEFTKKNVGKHGLPLLGFADWNDTVNLKTGAESLFIANQYGKALLDLIELCDYRGDRELSQRYRADYEHMRGLVNEFAWDGEWYVRYFDHDGSPIGSKKNAQGQIWTNGQSWPVLSGFATPDRARIALESVNRLLNTPNGIKLSSPGYDGYDPEKGGVTTYPPGAKENGGIFLHANPWVMIAETLVGNGDRAFQYYTQINPAAKNDRIDIYECEPYVYAQNILGNEHPLFGLARNSWLSGTASWCYQAGTQYILGVRAAYDGLLVDPCIPKDWDGFGMRRRFRGSIFEIVVKNPEHVCKGVRQLVVDGTLIDGNVVPVFPAGGTHRVEVVLGAAQAGEEAAQ